MAFNATAYSTRSYETLNGAIANTAGVTIAPGVAVKLVSLPTTPLKIITDQYFKLDIAGDKDDVFGVCSASAGGPITDSGPSRAVLLNAGMIPVLLSANGTKGDKIKVKTAKGEWAPIAVGETPLARLCETAVAGSLAWAEPL